MDAQLISKNGAVVALNEEQYEQILNMLGIVRLCPNDYPISETEAESLLAELQGISDDYQVFMRELEEDMRPDRVFDWWQQRHQQ